MLTNREFHLQTGNLAYKTGFSFTKRESWVTKGILELLFTLYSNFKLFLYLFTCADNHINFSNDCSTDVSEIEKEIKSYEKKLKILERNKESLYKDIDNLVDDDKIASRKREDMNKRLDNIYKDIEEVETLKLECEDKIDIIRKQEFNRDKIYEMLLHFDKIFDKLDDEEKQQLIQALISKVEVYKKNEIKTTKTYIKEITYAFDVFNLDTNFLGNKSNNVETVCLLSRK